MELHPYNDDRENKHNIYLHWDIYNLSHTLELQCSEIWIQSHVDKGEEEERRERKELPFFFFPVNLQCGRYWLIMNKKIPHIQECTIMIYKRLVQDCFWTFNLCSWPLKK
jgi:hypothetical protein